MIVSRESKRLKTSRIDWLNSSNALIQHLSEKMRFSRFPVLLGSAEATLFEVARTVKRLLIPYILYP